MKLSLRAVRNAVFVLLCVVFVAAQQRGVLASSNPFEDATHWWTSSYPCSLSGIAWSLNWDQVIHCDFEDNEEPDGPLTLGASMGDDLWGDCVDTCDEDPFLEAVSQALGHPEWCIDHWETYTSAASLDDSWARCKCNWYSYCF